MDPEMDMDLLSGPDLFQWPVANAVAFPSQSMNDSEILGAQPDTMGMDMEAAFWPKPRAQGPGQQPTPFIADPSYEEPESVAPSVSSASSRAVSISAVSRVPSASAVSPMINSANALQTTVDERQSLIPHPWSDQGRSILATAAELSTPAQDDPLYSFIKSYWSPHAATMYISTVHTSWPILDIRQVGSDGGDSLHPLLRAAMVLHVPFDAGNAVRFPKDFLFLVVEKALSRLLDFAVSQAWLSSGHLADVLHRHQKVMVERSCSRCRRRYYVLLIFSCRR